MRILGIITLILGIPVLVFGVLFLFNAASGEQEIADSIAPLPLDQVKPTYEQVFLAAKSTPQTDPQYLAIAGQRTSLGLAKANIGNVNFVRTSGIINIIIGAGLILTGIAIFRKGSSSTA